MVRPRGTHCLQRRMSHRKLPWQRTDQDRDIDYARFDGLYSESLRILSVHR